MGNRKYDQSFDIWSFACVFGEMMNGGPLFPGQNDLHQISKIGSMIGSPTEENWPSVKDMPNYGKLIFEKKSPENLFLIFMDSSKNEVKFLSSMLRYEQRLTAAELLKHPYFKEYPTALPKLLPEERLADIQVQDYEQIFHIQKDDF